MVRLGSGMGPRGSLRVALPIFHFFHFILTVHLARAHLAAPAGQQHRVVAGRRRALRLDVLAPHSTNDPALLVDLKNRG